MNRLHEPRTVAPPAKAVPDLNSSHSWALVVFCCLILSADSLVGQEISWTIPEDGGTPRDSARIESLGPAEFRVRASFEEGGRSVLRHAVSRMDLICRNDGKASAPVTLHLDLSGDGQRTDYDNKPEAGMAQRDFLFVKSPGRSWKQVDGTTDRWVATVTFIAEPGETKIGLSPWYTYEDYLGFIRALPERPHLEKRVVGRSDDGRVHWELTITDPAESSANKQTIFWQAREHAYETWSSFAMEGLVEFLLSDAAADFRRRYLFVLHPMTNLDGVARGYEYRGGYDFPDPRGTATGRATFEAVDRLRPAYAVAWHNWIAPRNRNVVFYTDGENGKPTSRAWLRFTQLFPSLHATGHRWKDESTPLRYNWQGRFPLSEVNIHQYAMKKHGTRIWGWEMPWWNFSEEKVRQSGREFAQAFLTTIDEIRSNSVPAAHVNAPVSVPRWEMHEFSLEARAHGANPFQDSALVGEFLSPSGRTNVVDGFYDGGSTWRLRFAPEEEGEWSYQLRGEGLETLQSGKLFCTPAPGHGFLRVHPDNPYAFAYADGTPFFPLGDTCYGLLDDSPITPALRIEYLETRRRQGFNFVRMQVGGSIDQAKRDSTFWAWGSTAREPDLDRLNPAFFHRLDELFRQMRTNGMNVELILLNFYRPPFTDTRQWTPERERLWLRYLVSRYGAFDHVFLWTVANEYETHPDGKYRLDFPSDVEWAKATARWIKANDSHRHLVTVHPVISVSRLGESPRSPFEPPWRIGEFYGVDDAMDVLSQQTGASGDTVTWDDELQCWKGDASTLVASLAADRKYRKPVLNSENGYEFLRGSPTEKKQVHHTDKVRRSAWRIVCAGGYVAAGFNGTIGHSDVWNRLDAPNNYTFKVKDEGAASQLGTLARFFTELPFWRMEPFGGATGSVVALAQIGKVYVVYFPHGGAASVDLVRAPGTFTARWFNPRLATYSPPVQVRGEGVRQFDAPDENDWALQLQLDEPTR